MKTFSNILSKAPDAARTYIEGKKVDEVECIVSDIPGIARGKAVPAQKFLRQKNLSFAGFHFLSNDYRWLGRSRRKRRFYRTGYDLEP
jgi:glutamine synthetase